MISHHEEKRRLLWTSNIDKRTHPFGYIVVSLLGVSILDQKAELKISIYRLPNTPFVYIYIITCIIYQHALILYTKIYDMSSFPGRDAGDIKRSI